MVSMKRKLKRDDDPGSSATPAPKPPPRARPGAQMRWHELRCCIAVHSCCTPFSNLLMKDSKVCIHMKHSRILQQ